MQNIHPWFVHFPIALLAVGVLFDFLGFIWKKHSLSAAGWWCSVFGVIAAIATIVTGFEAYFTVGHSTEAAHQIMKTHRNVQLVVGLLFTGLLIWRSFSKYILPRRTPIYFVIAATAVGLMLYGSHLGGQLVYEYGVGTALSVEGGHHDGTSTEAEHRDRDTSSEAESERPQDNTSTEAESQGHQNGTSTESEAHQHQHQEGEHSP